MRKILSMLISIIFIFFCSILCLYRRDAELYLSVSEENHTYYHSHHGLSSMFDQMPDLGVMKDVDSFRDSYYNYVEESMIPMHQTAQDLFK